MSGKRRRTVAVILAGGTGQRVGLNMPKQLIKVAGKPILQHTLHTFATSTLIDEIIVMMAPGFVADAEKIVVDTDPGQPTRVIEGGLTRSETTQLALAAVGDDECDLVLHDAVRPLVDHATIARCVAALERYEAVDVAIPSADTIIVVEERDGDEVINSIPSRAALRRGQTPQCFRASTLRRAYDLAKIDPNFVATDDCGVVKKYLPEVQIYVVPGTEHNMKVTHPIDVHLIDRLFQLAAHVSPEHPDEQVYRDRLEGRVAVIFGGTYGIGQAIAELLESYGATVHSFSRTATGTHVERAEDVVAAMTSAYAASGRIDFVINTAGVLHIGRLSGLDEAIVNEAIAVNYVAPVQIARAAHRYLCESRGSLLLFTSSSYTRGRADYSLYSSTKAAVVNLTQALADEWSVDGIRVNCINPERTATPMRTRAFGQEPLDTLLTADAVAAASMDVLISEMTGYIVDVRRTPRHDSPTGTIVEVIAQTAPEIDVEAILETG